MNRRVVVVLSVGALAASPLVVAQQTTFRAGVDVVVVPVSVTDRNQPVTGLSVVDFQLLDNDVPQEVTLTPIDKLPVDVTLLIDTSASLIGKTLDDVKSAVQQMGDMLQPSDRVRVLSVASNAGEIVPQQPAGSLLPVDRIVGGGTTALYDGLAAALVAYPFDDRPQFIFAVTDGRDNSSFLDADQVVALARSASALLCVALVDSTDEAVQVRSSIEAVNPALTEQSYMVVPPDVGLSTRSATIARWMGPYRGRPNTQALKAAAAMTGGSLYTNPSGGDIPELFRRVLDEFHAGYVLSYTPRGVAAGGWHAITVRPKNTRYSVRARNGYQAK